MTLLTLTNIARSQSANISERSELFARLLLNLHGARGQISAPQVENMMRTIRDESCPHQSALTHSMENNKKSNNSCFAGQNLDVNCLSTTVGFYPFATES